MDHNHNLTCGGLTGPTGVKPNPIQGIGSKRQLQLSTPTSGEPLVPVPVILTSDERLVLLPVIPMDGERLLHGSGHTDRLRQETFTF